MITPRHYTKMDLWLFTLQLILLLLTIFLVSSVIHEIEWWRIVLAIIPSGLGIGYLESGKSQYFLYIKE